ncbi:hypothetical protein Dsin_031292 [Dipteronia sinensis]|uniref:Reverse transcriptase zinc-binding domain-containing protein n=1 Tax=Dipteronia sinensis TaxID=43782 RepID=A0AAE0DRZ4_9ROSI|nr:hypothetical protein Dsin_031292 [Dipteronia sinensis]
MIPSKIKLFIWRACNNWLPTQMSLVLRKIPVDNRCPLHSRRPESTMHAFWCCPSLKPLRSACTFMKGAEFHDSGEFFDILLSNKFKLLQCCVWFFGVLELVS